MLFCDVPRVLTVHSRKVGGLEQNEVCTPTYIRMQICAHLLVRMHVRTLCTCIRTFLCVHVCICC